MYSVGCSIFREAGLSEASDFLTQGPGTWCLGGWAGAREEAALAAKFVHPGCRSLNLIPEEQRRGFTLDDKRGGERPDLPALRVSNSLALRY